MTLTFWPEKPRRIRKLPIAFMLLLVLILIIGSFTALLLTRAHFHPAWRGPSAVIIDLVWQHTHHATLTKNADIWQRLEVGLASMWCGVIAGLIELILLPLCAGAAFLFFFLEKR